MAATEGRPWPFHERPDCADFGYPVKVEFAVARPGLDKPARIDEHGTARVRKPVIPAYPLRLPCLARILASRLSPSTST